MQAKPNITMAVIGEAFINSRNMCGPHREHKLNEVFTRLLYSETDASEQSRRMLLPQPCERDYRLNPLGLPLIANGSCVTCTHPNQCTGLPQKGHPPPVYVEATSHMRECGESQTFKSEFHDHRTENRMDPVGMENNRRVGP